MKGRRQGSFSDQGKQGAIWGCGLCKGEQEEKETSWQREVRKRTAGCHIGSLSLWGVRLKIHTQNSWWVWLREAEAEEEEEGEEEDLWKSGSASQPAAGDRRPERQLVKGLMPSGGLWAALLRYPKMVESISFNYINRAEISCFYGNKCESFGTKQCQALNIAVRVMCHCQTDMWTVA